MGRDNFRLNRWLIEIQSILNSGGIIEPVNVDGLLAAYAQIAANLHSINVLNAEVATNTADIATLQGDVTTLQGQIATNTANIAVNTADIVTLTARNQILNGAGAPGALLGNNGDLYINNTGGAGTFLYGKIGGVWQVFA